MDIEEAKKQLLKHKKEIDAKFISARYSKAIEVVLSELEKKDKIINLMAEIIEECRQNDCLESDEIDLSEIAGTDRIIDYFTNKVEEDK